MKNYKIDATLLPEVWTTWCDKDGRIWMDKDGNRQRYAEWWMAYDDELSVTNHRYRSNDGRTSFGFGWNNHHAERIWVASGAQVYYAYAKYHEDIDRLELAAVKYDTTRKEEKKEWHYAGDRIFIDRNKDVINQSGNCQYNWFTIKKGSQFRDVRDAIRAIVRLTANDKFLAEFKKFIGRSYFVMGNGATECIMYNWHINKWYDTVQKKKVTGKSQKLVDKLVQLPLGNIDYLAQKYPPKPRSAISDWDVKTMDNILYFERVNDEWGVLRALIRNDCGKLDEGWRVYLGDDGTNRIVSNSDGEWIPATQSRGWYFSRQYYFANKDEAIEKCDRIKYIAPILESADGVDSLITALKFPTIEQLYKMGQTNLALNISRDSQPKAHIKRVFGYYNEKEKNVLRQIGMTKHQLDVYCAKRQDGNNRWHYNDRIIATLRETFGNDLSHIDNATFDKYLDAFDIILRDMWSCRCVDNLDIDKSRFWKNVVRLNDKNSNTARLISDTLSAYFYIHGEPIEVDWFFDDYSDIVRTHDALVAIQNEREAERRAYYNMEEAKRREKDEEKRKKTDENRKHYEYEDDDFIIRLPKDVYEIIQEGSRQHICIGGYTQRHSNGDTNLFFLRKRDDETTPFYAIEMSKNKVIVQIHGFGNKWLGNNPEAIPTVVRWLRKHDIKCDKTILTCTAIGYGRTNEYITMPQVD